MSAKFFWDGYLHWAREQEKALLRPFDVDSQLMMEPVFGRIRDPLSRGDALNFLRNRRLIDEDGHPLPFDSENVEGISHALVERQGLTFLDGKNFKFDPEEVLTGLIHYAVAGHPLEFFFYRNVAETEAEHQRTLKFADVIDLGAAALVEQIVQPPPDKRPAGIAPPRAIAALIDNDVGFLNVRFRQGSGETRFSAIWLQSREWRHGNSVVAGTHIHVGRVLTAEDIDTEIGKAGQSERSSYRRINTDLHLRPAFQVAPPINGHGSAVADLAFGDQPGAGISGYPLLAVQLPPEAAFDTSGTTSESYIVQGFRWLCARARRLARNTPLVVNISYGVIAGPKDGSRFLEEQIKREIILAEAYGQTVHVVYAFGNSRNLRQVARLRVPSGADAQTPDWIVPPDNAFPSFMEIRAITIVAGRPRLGAPPDKLAVTLISPDGTEALTGSAAPGRANPSLDGYSGPGTAPCRLYNVPGRRPPDRPAQPGFLMLAIAPTKRPPDPLASAPPGSWALTIHNPTSTVLDLVLQIQRGDRAPGFTMGGRQSCFDGIFVTRTENDVLIRDVQPPLTNEGTNSSYTTASHVDTDGATRIHTAGAMIRSFGADLRADYSAEGAEWTAVEVPTADIQVDTASLAGQPVSGTYSGSRTRLSGTSAAAALESRRLLLAP